MPKEVYILPKELTAFLAKVSNSNFADILVATYEVGCRPQDRLQVEARHVDLDRHR